MSDIYRLFINYLIFLSPLYFFSKTTLLVQTNVWCTYGVKLYLQALNKNDKTWNLYTVFVCGFFFQAVQFPLPVILIRLEWPPPPPPYDTLGLREIQWELMEFHLLLNIISWWRNMTKICTKTGLCTIDMSGSLVHRFGR